MNYIVNKYGTILNWRRVFKENTMTGMLQAHIALVIISHFGIGQFVRGINMDLFGLWKREAPKLRGQIFAELSIFFCNRKRLGGIDKISHRGLW